MHRLLHFLLGSLCLLLLVGCMHRPEPSDDRDTSKALPPAKVKLGLSDMSMRLEIDEMPDGLQDIDITMAQLGADALPISVDDATIQAWEFGPDGTEFPAGANMIVEIDGGTVPYVFHVDSDGQLALVDGVSIDAQDGRAFAKIPVRGFSSFVLVNPAEDEMFFSKKVGEGVVGDPLTLTLQVNLNASEFIVLPGSIVSQTYYIRPEGKSIEGSLTYDESYDIHPNSDDPIYTRLFGKPSKILSGRPQPLQTSMFNDQYTIVTPGYMCERPGIAHVYYNLMVNFLANSIEEGSMGDYLQLDKLGGNMERHVKLRVRGEVVCHPKPVIPPEPECGNHILESGEQCDRYHLNNQTCETQGYVAGRLRCNDECQFDYAECISAQTYSCSDNTRESGSLYRRTYDICEDNCPAGQQCSRYDCTCYTPTPPSSGDTTSLIGIPVEPPITTHTVIDNNAAWDRSQLPPEPQFDQATIDTILEEMKAAASSSGDQEDDTLPGVDDPTPEETTQEIIDDAVEMMAVIEYNSQYISVGDVTQCDGSECNGEDHWHVLSSELYDIYGIPVELPEEGACGVSLGTLAEVPVEVVAIPGE